MTKVCISLPDKLISKINEYKSDNDLNFSQATAELSKRGIESLKNNNEVIDFYSKIKDIHSSLIYLIALIEQFYSDMEIDGGTNPKKCDGLKMFWSKRLKDSFND